MKDEMVWIRSVAIAGIVLLGAIAVGLFTVQQVAGSETELTNGCTSASVVPYASINPDLVSDCRILLVARDTLAGSATLNWSTGLSMQLWDGITLEDRPPRLIKLDLEGRGLTGKIPPGLGDLSNIQQFRLPTNQLAGTIPLELGSISTLRELDLERNQLTGELPKELGQLLDLKLLRVNKNNLTGRIPPELGRLTKLGYLGLTDNQLTGTIPPELRGLSNLSGLLLDSNDLTGPIPSWLGNLPNLHWLFLHKNRFTGTIPTQLGKLDNLTWLVLANNQLTGEVPTELGNLSNLQVLMLVDNLLTGRIPSELGSLSKLRRLALGGNQLTGPIPTSLGSLSNLTQLWLNDSQLTGQIPTELGNLANLAQLRLSGNQLIGCVPEGLRYVRDNDLDVLGLPFCDVVLSALRVGPRSLTPEFDPTHTEYTTVSGLSPITVVPTSTGNTIIRYLDEHFRPIRDADHDIDGHQVELGSDVTTIKVEAGSQDGATATVYTVSVTYENLLDRYDADDDGEYDRNEVVTAVGDYFNDAIGRDEIIAIMVLYFSSSNT